MRLLCCTILAAIAAQALRAQSAPGPRGAATAAQAWQRFAARSHAALAALNHPDATALPPTPTGVADLAFSEFFGPIGDRGLEYSPKLRALDGHRVRLAGYMVRVQEHAAGLFLFAGWPAVVQTKGLCAIDDAPPSAVHVLLPSAADRLVPYRPGRIILIGRLELGPRAEADGRNSTVRLLLDAESLAMLLPASSTPPRPP